MIYEIESNTMLFEINRTQIVDISVGDTLQAKDFPKGQYIWAKQDSQFLESNPDARLFLKIQKISGDNYRGVGIMIIPD